MASELRVNTITSTTGVGTVTLGSGGVSFSGTPTFNDVTLSSINGNAISGTRNRIINGDCRIDQRNNGASGTAAAYTIDRWFYFATQASKGTWQQNAGSVTPPVGFANYLGYTSSSAFTPAVSDYFGISPQVIEGYNISDLAWGTANAKPVTLSFWIRSSLTGQFGGFLKNGGNLVAGNSNRYCGFSYTINSANTWEYKTITFLGDTSGSWDSTNGSGLAIAFSLGAGSTYTGGTPLTWGGTFYNQPSGSTNIVSTNGATFYITGVQLEAGTVATPFERRSIGQELALCQRYYQKSYDILTAPGASGNEENAAILIATSTTRCSAFVRFSVEMRSDPIMTAYSTAGTAAALSLTNNLSNAVTTVAFSGNHYSPTGFQEISVTSGLTAGTHYQMHWTAAAEL